MKTQIFPIWHKFYDEPTILHNSKILRKSNRPPPEVGPVAELRAQREGCSVVFPRARVLRAVDGRQSAGMHFLNTCDSGTSSLSPYVMGCSLVAFLNQLLI